MLQPNSAPPRTADDPARPGAASAGDGRDAAQAGPSGERAAIDPAHNGPTQTDLLPPAGVLPGSVSQHAEGDVELDNLVALAAQLFDCPIALLSVAEGGLFRILADHGYHKPLVPREHALCRVVDYATPLLVVPDAAVDERFRDDPAVTGADGVRFYAGVGLFGDDGMQLGVLALADRRPRAALVERERSLLLRLALLAARTLETRRNLDAIQAQASAAASPAMLVMDACGTVTELTPAARALLGSGVAIGQPVQDVFPPVLQDDPDATLAWLFAGVGTGGPADDARELRFRRGGVLHRVEAQRCLSVEVDGTTIVLREIADRPPLPILADESEHDALTDIPARGALLARLGGFLARGGSPVLAVLGLDNFRAINDALGPAIGDSVLQVVACRLLARMPADTVLARIGGDEFGLVFPDAGEGDGDDVAGIDAQLQAVLRDIGRPCHLDQHRIDLQASIGATRHGIVVDAGGIVLTDTTELLARASLAMHAAKQAGGHRIRWFDPGMRSEAMDRRQLDLELRRACVEDQFELHYQPQVDLASGCPTGAEALLRWRHPERGLLPPAAFIDALSASVVAPDVGRWILQRACRDAASWSAAGGRRLAVAVNLFPVQLDDERLLGEVDRALADSGLEPGQLELELTETIALRRDGMAERLIAELRGRGVRVSFDDFGTGFASLSMLRRLPVDRVKIDQSFVQNVTDNRGDEAIVRSIALMARNFDMEVIAEGVETRLQETFLREIGCEEVQGFLYSRALPAGEFRRWLERNGCTQCRKAGRG